MDSHLRGNDRRKTGMTESFAERGPNPLDARKTNAEMRERIFWYVTEAKRRMTPQTGVSVGLITSLRTRPPHPDS